jgi:hypothetical protein
MHVMRCSIMHQVVVSLCRLLWHVCSLLVVQGLVAVQCLVAPLCPMLRWRFEHSSALLQ